MEPVVGIERQDQIAARGGDAGVTGGRQAAVFLLQQTDAATGIARDQGTGDIPGVVGAAVVDDHQLPARAGLRDHAGDRSGSRCACR
jgi:hypothetical protein